MKSKVFIHGKIIKRFLSFSIDNEIGIIQKSLSNKVNKKIFHKNWNLFQSTSKNIDQSMTNIILFPGQGTQFVGMGKDNFDIPQIQQLFETASEFLKFDLKSICLDGPLDKLTQTIYNQPAIFVTSLAAIEKLRQSEPWIVENCIATAGMSLGEITSLVFAGALSYKDGLKFISVRARAMEQACMKVQGGLMVVSVNAQSNLTEAMNAAKRYCQEKLNIENPVCELSTYLFTENRTIGGHLEALDFVKTFAKDFKLKVVKQLNVSGAFHTSLMNDAYEACVEALESVEVSKPRIPVMSNATGTVHKSPRGIKQSLATQVNHAVLWEQILHRLYMRPDDNLQPTTLAVGPGSNLGAMVKRVNARAFERYRYLAV